MTISPGKSALHASPIHLLEARHLVKRYGGRTVVDDVDLLVAAGEVVGVISVYTRTPLPSD